MRIRPTEVRAIAALLDEPADSAEDLARMVIEKLAELREKRQEYVVLVAEPGMTSVRGFFDTPNQAKRALGKSIIASRPGVRGGVFPVIKSDTEEG